MIQTISPKWDSLRTEETRVVEETLRNAGLDQVDVYRYNVASIRVRVIDPRFEGLSTEERYAMVEPHLECLPERTQADIISLLALAPSEIQQSPTNYREYMDNVEFDDPSPSTL